MNEQGFSPAVGSHREIRVANVVFFGRRLCRCGGQETIRAARRKKNS